jgi:soluble lytic murein transglycosylase
MSVAIVGTAGACSGAEDLRGYWRDVARHIDAPPSVESVEDTTVTAAAASIREGRPWRATEMLDPVLRDPSRRTPDAVMVAARAASAWAGWAEVRRLLDREPWLDSAFAGEGHALLARAAFEGNRPDFDSIAVIHGQRAVDVAVDSASGTERLVLLARALDRVRRTDDARIAWQRAATLTPWIGDWFLLRAAALEPTARGRATLFSRLVYDASRAREPWVEADARERFGDLTGAARVLDSLGASVEVLRLRMRAAETRSSRATIRRELVRMVASQPGSATARRAAVVLDRTVGALTPSEQLVVARSAAINGPAARAASAFAGALAAGLGTAQDRYAYGRVLERLGRHDSAIEQFARASRTPALAGKASYQRARSLLRAGRLAESRTALRAVVRHPGDPVSSASALFLLADLATDEQRDGAGRSAFLELVRRYPRSSLAPRAAMRAAIIAFVHDSVTTAAREFDALRARYRTSDESVAATYWAGRAWVRAGDPVRAKLRWESVIDGEPRGYYAILARARLGRPRVTLPPNEQAHVRNGAVDSAVARAVLLDRLGLDREAQHEYDRVEREARRSARAARAAAAAFDEYGLSARTIRLAAQALRHSATADVPLYRALYPLPYEKTIRFESRAQGVDAALVAALVRQESSFVPSATSAAGARGLMQIMPAVGRQSAVARSAVAWTDALLYQPDVSLRLGTAHLATVLARYAQQAAALAAYNAGESRVDRWLRKPGSGDVETFVERIPYVETRDYVRIVLRNLEWYRHLYEL